MLKKMINARTCKPWQEKTITPSIAYLDFRKKGKRVGQHSLGEALGKGGGKGIGEALSDIRFEVVAHPEGLLLLNDA